jgi:hypothetical protein
MLAQALLEKGMLDGLILQFANVATGVSVAFQERPWLWIVVAVGVILLLRKGRG